MLSRDQILAFQGELKRETIESAALGGSVQIRVMTGSERDRFEVLVSKNDRRHFRATLLAFTMCDESGALLFAETDIPTLGKLPAHVLEPIVETSLRLNRFTGDDISEFQKNSEASPSADSASA